MKLYEAINHNPHILVIFHQIDHRYRKHPFSKLLMKAISDKGKVIFQILSPHFFYAYLLITRVPFLIHISSV